jgi:hypothetical protein
MSSLVCQASALLGGHCGQVALGGVGGEAQHPSGLSPTDWWGASPPRQPEPQCVHLDMGNLLCVFIFIYLF